MHSRIFQVSTTEIAPSDYIQPDDVSDHLCDNGVADYVDDVEDRAEELKYLMGSFKNIFVKGPGQFSFQIAEGGKEHYFKPGYKAYEAKFGYYIYEDDTLEPLSEWLRNADNGVTYYFGNVLDYHF